MNDPPVATSAGPNAGQIDYWNGRTGVRWTQLQARIDALFAPLTETLIDFAVPAAGEHVLDIGCGCGGSLLAMANRLGPEGRILGVDVSKIMLEIAARRTGDDPRLGTLQADASVHPFGTDAFSLLFSRFGVMFFEDPVAAFSHLRTTLAPGGRLAFVAWRAMAENPWFMVPFAAVAALFPERPPSDPEAPGPFAFADPEHVRRILEQAGFTAASLTRHDLRIRLSGPGERAQATAFAAQIGPTASLLTDADDAEKAAAAAAIGAALAPHETSDGLSLAASVWLVSAKA